MEHMKKILIADDIKSVIEKKESFFNRENIRTFTSSSNEEALSLHKTEKVDLIITHLDTPQMDGETLCSLIRNERKLQSVSIIMVCPNSKFHIERQSQCRANAFLYEPLNLPHLFGKAHQLLHIAQRRALRAPIAIKVHGKYKDKPFLCISENISVSGMLFHTDRIIDQGDTIICAFFLPNSLHFLTEAEIVRVIEKKFELDTFHYGIRFSNLNSSDKAAIEKYTGEKFRRLKAISNNSNSM